MLRVVKHHTVIETPVRPELRVTLDEMVTTRQMVVAAFGSVAVACFLGYAMFTYYRELPSIDNPAVMTGGPAPATNVPRLEPMTTTGQAVAPEPYLESDL